MRTCAVEGCQATYYAKNYCFRHYKQVHYFGKIRERTILTLNEYIMEGDICKIALYNRKCVIVWYTLINIDWVEKCKPFKWYFQDGYVETIKDGCRLKLHHFILGIKSNPNSHVDHINRNRLDNRVENLRIASFSDNQCNKGLRSDNKSGYKGVTWDKSKLWWKAQIMKDKHNYNIGYFNTKEEAALAYNKEALLLHGEFAVLNSVKPKLKRRIL